MKDDKYLMNLRPLLYTFMILFSSSAVAISWANRGGLITDEKKDMRGSWLKLGRDSRESVIELIKIIESNSSGQRLIARARMKARTMNKSLYDVVTEGEVSLTDTTLVRKFSASNPFDVRFEVRSEVYVDRNHNVKDAVLDLIHELTHFTFKKPFNPYKSDFKISEFMKDTIEGKGGEIEAFLVECRVGHKIYGLSRLSAQCQSIVSSSGNLSKLLALREFYKLGNFYNKFLEESKEMGLDVENFKYISDEDGVIVSSAWGSPYPMAILDEYSMIMKKVCRNDRHRLSYYAPEASRSPASLIKSYAHAKKEFARRCK